MLETLSNKTDHIDRKTLINSAYLLYQEGSRRVYVGSSKQPGLRTSNHLWLLSRNEHSNPTFQKLYNENPNFYKVYYTVGTRQEAYELEQALINYYEPTGLLINHALDAITPNKGIKRTPENIAKLRAAKLGVPRSEEAKRRVSEGMMGRVQSDETKLKLSIAKKGKPQPATVAELCRERNRLRSKAVSCDGVVYVSIREAARSMDMARDNVKTRVRSSMPRWSNWFYV